MEDYLLLIDGSSLLTTQFYGNLPKEIMFAKTREEKELYYHKIMKTSSGIYTNAVYGFLRYLFKILKEQKPAYIAVAWDISRNTFRREMYAEYKANRDETLVPLKQQFVLCQEVLERFGIVQLMDSRYEADDFCGSAARKFEAEIPVRILTKDNDYLQLADERTSLWMMHNSPEKAQELFKKYDMVKAEAELPEKVFCYTPELIRKEFGVDACNINSLKGLMGDSSDNIKGVPGVGPASAVKLIQEYKTVGGLYETIEKTDEKELKEYWKNKLGLKRSPLSYLTRESDEELTGKKAAFLSEKLATIKTDIPIPYTLKQLKTQINTAAVKGELERLEFKSLHYDVQQESVNSIEESRIHITSDFDYVDSVMKKLKKASRLSLLFACTREEFYGAAVSDGEEAYYFPQEYFLMKDMLINYSLELINKVSCIYAADVKLMLNHLDIKYTPSVKDIAIGAYLLNPLAGSYPTADIASKYCKMNIASYDLSKGLTSETAYDAGYQKYMAECAYAVFKSGEVIEKRLQEENMLELFNNIEMPLVFDLSRMEKTGILVMKEALQNYGSELVEGIEQLKTEIYSLAGEEFNILSPKQLGVILFEKLGIAGAKKTKNGYSTSADVLEKLADDYEIVKKVLSYRQLTKLKSTYADGLAGYISEDGRIHGVFNQTITATGRISSTEPNLQNIPVRMELGRAIRKVFVPQEGCVFVDADYSQIELRVLAHMSGDEGLINAYRSAQDIHALTASQVFHVPIEQVTPLMRRNAKAVNFGIVYGISAFGLSEDLSITRKEATQYIGHYFETYPKVKEFLDRMVNECRNKGYSVTIFGRRRPVVELKSSNFMQRQFGERIAMNSPIQGTAADIMKIAMTRVNRRIDKEGLKARIVLQVHDELLLEVPENEKDITEQILREEMENAAKLEVKLEVSVSDGKSWYETK